MQNQNEQGRKRANNNKIALEIRTHHRNIYMAQSRNYETHNHKRKVLSDVHTSASYQIFALFSVKLCGDSLPSPLSRRRCLCRKRRHTAKNDYETLTMTTTTTPTTLRWIRSIWFLRLSQLLLLILSFLCVSCSQKCGSLNTSTQDHFNKVAKTTWFAIEQRFLEFWFYTSLFSLGFCDFYLRVFVLGSFFFFLILNQA